MNNRPLDEEAIFHIAKDLSDTAKRAAYLDQVCGSDQERRERIEALLDSHESQTDFLKSDDRFSTTAVPAVQRKDGNKDIGPYKIREQIGEGGMGIVYVAEQQSPVKRKVALKVIKPGMDSKEVVARFEAERQALAMMDHPGIAKVFDGGVTETGQPYFAMELINGMPITQYCDEQKLGIKERLELFIAVCHAVQHAHQKGVIHRDIKPTNVLVTLHDGKPVPVVIDFGVAKATNQNLTDQTIYTRMQQVIGTTLYMSPEQAELSRFGVDTRTDIYSLGVLLYEMLAGTTPFDRERFKQAALDEVRRIIREEEPPKPSTRLSTLGDTATKVSSLRRTDPQKLRHSLRGDLDWIVMMALDKDRNRRYETANGLAMDVTRYLDDEPILARPPSAWYRMQKFYSRNKALTTTVLLVLFALATGLTWALMERNNARVATAKEKKTSNRLNQQNLKLEAALDQLRRSELNQILESIIAGDTDDAEARLELVKESQAAETDVQIATALIQLFGVDSNPERACTILSKVNRDEPDNVVAHSLLVMSYFYSGREWDYWKSVVELWQLQPSTFEDYLFRGFANTWGYPFRALEDLREANKLNPASPIGKCLLALALTQAAHETIDRHEALRLAKEAEFQTMIARNIYPSDNPFQRVQRIQALTKTVSLLSKLKDESDTDIAAKFRNELILEIEDSQKKFPNTNNRELRLAMLLAEDVLGGSFVLDPNWETLHVSTGGPEEDLRILTAKIQHRYLHDPHNPVVLEPVDKKRLCDQLVSSALYPEFVGRLAKGESHTELTLEYAKLMERENRDHRNINGMNDWAFHKLMGSQPSMAQAAMQRFVEFNSQFTELDHFPKFLGDASRPFAKGSKPSGTILEHAKRNREIVSVAYWLGIEHLVAGQPEKAKDYFKKVVDTDFYQLVVYRWSQLFLKRLEEDEHWHPWRSYEGD